MEFNYRIEKQIAVLSEKSSGWKKELNLVSWNGGKPKYDIREWAPGHEKMGKGITLSRDEAEILAAVLCEEIPDEERDEAARQRMEGKS